MFKRLRDRIDLICRQDAEQASRWARFARGQVRLCVYIVRELIRNNCPQQAAALTFTTLLSLVPLLVVAFAFLRSFAPLEGMEKKAQGAVFRAILAGPLLEAGGGRPPAGSVAPEDLARVARMPSGAALAEADGRPHFGDLALTFSLYARALEDPSDAAQARRRLSTLRLSPLDPLRGALAAAGGDALQNYRRAAQVSSAESLRSEPAAEAAAAAAFAERGALPEAVEHYRTAVLGYCDALVLAAPDGAAEMAGLAKAHDEALAALADALFLLGKQEAGLFGDLRTQHDPAAEKALAAALTDLNDAAALMEHPSDVHAALGDVYAAAGRDQEALQEYRTALAKSREVAARDISVAVVDYIRMLVDKVGRTEMGILGSLLLLAAAVVLLNTIETTLNRIWQVTRYRPFWIKFTSFCTLMWLGPVLIGASLWVQERLGHYIGGVSAIGGLFQLLGQAARHGLSFLATWAVLLALYRFLPNARVRFRSAALGALVAGILVQAARPLFTGYVMHVVRYDRIYGSLSVIPMFLLWVWLLWLLVLFGAEVSFTIQNVDLLLYRDRLYRLASAFIDRYLAVRVMVYIGREFWDTGRPVSAGRLAEMLQMTPEAASDAAGRLVNLGLLTPVGQELDEFHPARDLSRMKLSELLNVTDRFRSDSRSTRPEDQVYEAKLEETFRTVTEAEERALRDMTLRDLLQECEGDRKTEATTA
jgi:membrane protein